MKEKGVEGCSRYDFEVSDKKMWTFDDVFEDLMVKKGKLGLGRPSWGKIWGFGAT